MEMKEKYIIKEDGQQQLFNEEKIRESLINAGADNETANNIMEFVRKNYKDYMHSKDIYRLAMKQLGKKQPSVALRYSLKKAIMDLGPTGFVFEKYVAKIMREYGYKTETGRVVRGFCVDHEVDVIGEKDGCHYMMECKYHNDKDTGSDIKTALYVNSRFQDIKRACEVDLNKYDLKEGWLVTNTKVTSDASKYARCVNLKIVAWHYPRQKNLEYYIENKKLYPVSILNGLNKNQKKILFDKEIITIKDLLEYDPDSIAGEINTSPALAQSLFRQAKLLIGKF